MKQIVLLLIFAFPLFVFGQKDTTIYFGVNGKVNHIEKPAIKKEIDYRGSGKTEVNTYKINEDKWQLLYSEKIKVLDDSTFLIRMKGDEFSGRLIRRMELLENGNYKFTDWLEDRIKRTGETKFKIPLFFEGEVTEFYTNGRIKSVSQYINNELISNQNWLPNGDKTVDDIFYSVDREPLFNPGLGNLHAQILKKIKESEFDLTTVEGRIVVGFVVLKNGEIGGVRIITGLAGSLDYIAAQAFNSIEGTWTPAQLNNESVNYLQLFPINFIYTKYDFDYLELKGSMLYWEIN